MTAITESQQTTRRMLLDWLRTDHGVETATTKLSDPIALDSDGFVAEVKKSRGKGATLTSANLARLREEYARSIPPARALASEALSLESRLSDLVNAAYGLTPADVSLLWDTAPPRMPIPRPESPEAS